MALTFLFCALAWREIAPDGTGTLAAILLLGSFGLVVRAHQLIPDVAGLAGFAMVYYGCARSLRGAAGGVWLGTGVGVVFLSLGTPESVTVTLIALVLPLVSSAWRTRAYAKALGLALLAALPWIAIWPFALYAHSPDMFREWLQADTVKRLFEGAGAGFYYLRILPWYSWPLWALALWSLWRAFGAGPAKPATVLPLTGLLVTLLALTEATDKRELYALPLLLPLTLLAAPGAQTLRRGAANAWYWFSIMFFTFFILVGWVYWSGLELGIPARLHAHLHRLQPGYASGFRLLPFVLGLAFTLTWFAVLAKVRKKNPERPAIVWGTGVAVIWGMAATLFVGYLDTGKSYRSVFTELAAAVPARHRCIASRDLGEPQRAMLHYFGGIVTLREEALERALRCDLLLVQGQRDERAPDGAAKIWEGSRPGDKVERYRLYRRHAQQAQ